MKKTILFATFLFFSALAFAGEPTPKVLAAFQKDFQQVSKVYWHKEGHNFIAYFIQDEITHSLAYNGKGNLLGGIRYYTEKYLPFAVRTKVQKQFRALSIYGVTEVNFEGETVYEIYLQNADTLLTIRTSNFGEVVPMARYKRADNASLTQR